MDFKEIHSHEKLFLGSSFKLGNFFWFLLKAATEMNKLVYKHPLGGRERRFIGVSEYLTPFTSEILPHEIHWWVYKKESDIEELKSKTEVTLKAAQKLKENI
ncbi:MAG: hypothetical protein ACFFB5_20895 [Promethearchaeota archaeon]